MSIFTFPFMVMSIGTALSNVDPTLEEAAACLGARSWQTFRRVDPAADPGGRRGRHAAGLRLEHRDVRRAASCSAGSTSSGRSPGRSTSAAWSQTDYGVSATMGIVLLVVAFVVTYFSLRYSRGALVE